MKKPLVLEARKHNLLVFAVDDDIRTAAEISRQSSEEITVDLGGGRVVGIYAESTDAPGEPGDFIVIRDDGTVAYLGPEGPEFRALFEVFPAPKKKVSR